MDTTLTLASLAYLWKQKLNIILIVFDNLRDNPFTIINYQAYFELWLTLVSGMLHKTNIFGVFNGSHTNLALRLL
jgi:hypothetical protein